MAQQTWVPKRIRSEEERNSGNSDYISLKKEENFLGIPLFEGDPKIDEPGYYEYFEHWDQAAQRRVPCPGEEVCPLCAEGESPSTRGKSLWLVYGSKIKGVSKTYDPPKVMIFTMNWNLIKMFTEKRVEGDKIKGLQFRVSCVDDRGNYSLTSKDEKITATAIKEALKGAPDLEKNVTAQLRKAMQAYSLRAALDDEGGGGDGAEPDEEPTTQSTGKSKPAAKKKEPAAWPDEAEEITVKVEGLDGNIVNVTSDDYEDDASIYGTDGKDGVDFTELEPGAAITVSYETDGDGDKVATAFEVAEQQEEESASGGKLPAKLEDEVVEITGDVNPQDGLIPVTSEEYGEFTLYVLDGVEMDWDDYTVGKKIKFSAELDVSDDPVTTEAPEIVKETAKKTAAKTSTGRKKTAA